MRFSLPVSAVLIGLLFTAGCGDSFSPTSTEQAALTPAPGSGGLVEFAGGVEALTPDSITVNGRTFQVDTVTVTLRNGNQVSFRIVRVGDIVIIKASQNRNGIWMAREIKIRS